MQATYVNLLTPKDVNKLTEADFLVYGAFPVDSKGQPAPGQRPTVIIDEDNKISWRCALLLAVPLVWDSVEEFFLVLKCSG